MFARPPKRQWTDAEIRQLQQLADEKAGADAIAKALDRSRASVRQKAFWLDVSLADDRPKAKRK
jgi:hypothetical protein